MKRTFAILFSIAYLAGQDAPKTPEVSSKTIIAYKDAVIALAAANKAYDDFGAEIKRQFENILKRQQQAVQAGQAALDQAQADCGKGFLVDGDLFQKSGELKCVAAPAEKE